MVGSRWTERVARLPLFGAIMPNLTLTDKDSDSGFEKQDLAWLGRVCHGLPIICALQDGKLVVYSPDEAALAVVQEAMAAHSKGAKLYDPKPPMLLRTGFVS
jgi:hypothetical protein